MYGSGHLLENGGGHLLEKTPPTGVNVWSKERVHEEREKQEDMESCSAGPHTARGHVQRVGSPHHLLRGDCCRQDIS